MIVDVKLPVRVVCAKCGKDLDVEVRPTGTFEVSACEDCQVDAHNEGYDEGYYAGTQDGYANAVEG